MIAALWSVGCGDEVFPGSTKAADFEVGDCLRVGGAIDRPEAAEVACGSAESNYKVVATVTGGAELCPPDVDSFYSQRGGLADQTTVCMDIDWVLGGCMSVDPDHRTHPVRVDCADRAVPFRQRATQILTDVARVDQCASGLGYAYTQRQFTVCVENLR